MKSLIALALLGVAAPAVAQTSAEPVPMKARTNASAYTAMAASSDTYEMQSSKLALQHAANPDVRRFATMMTSDHANTTAQLTAAAKEARLRVPASPAPMHKAMLKDLRAAGHDKMERLYVDQQVMAHEQALALHQGYAAQGDNPRLKAVAAAAAPIVEQHLSEIRRIQTAMGGPMTTTKPMR